MEFLLFFLFNVTINIIQRLKNVFLTLLIN